MECYLFAGLQTDRSESASGGGTGIACCAGASLDTHVEWPSQHRVKLQLVNAVLLGGLVVVSVYLTTATGYSEQNIAFLNTLGQVFRAHSCGQWSGAAATRDGNTRIQSAHEMGAPGSSLIMRWEHPDPAAHEMGAPGYSLILRWEHLDPVCS